MCNVARIYQKNFSNKLLFVKLSINTISLNIIFTKISYFLFLKFSWRQIILPRRPLFFLHFFSIYFLKLQLLITSISDFYFWIRVPCTVRWLRARARSGTFNRGSEKLNWTKLKILGKRVVIYKYFRKVKWEWKLYSLDGVYGTILK